MLKVFEVLQKEESSILAEKFSLKLDDYSRAFVLTENDVAVGLGVLVLKSMNIFLTLKVEFDTALQRDLLFRSLLNSCSFLNDFTVNVSQDVSTYVGGQNYLNKFGFIKNEDNYSVLSQNIVFKCC